MGATWYFREPSAGETYREATQGEYFLNEAIERPAQPLVREAIQNSLDATPDGQVTRVRVFLSDAAQEASAADCAAFAEGLWGHLESDGAQLRSAPSRSHTCRFLVIEDFGTAGLTGDPYEAFADESENQFFDFFRAEGRTSKQEGRLGRWGMGKFVFPQCSDGNTFFGLTRRHSDQCEYLLGRCVLRHHSLDGQRFTPDGYFGTRSINEPEFVVPITESGVIEQFKQAFNVSRHDETGLSVVIPWCDSEIEFGHLLEAVITEYAVAILTNSLVVEVESGYNAVEVNSATLLHTAEQFAHEFDEDGVLEYLRFLVRAMSIVDGCVELPVPPTTGAPKWNEETVPTESATTIEQILDSGAVASIRVPVWVRPKELPDVASEFFVYLERVDSDNDGRATFVRKDLLVSEPSRKGLRGYFGLVHIPYGPLATMLGLAENPAHTRWQKNSSKFKDRYTLGPGMLKFVETAIHGILARLWRDTEEDDPDFFGEYFSIPEPEKPGRKRKKRRSRNGDPPPPKPARLRINQCVDGFTVVPGDAAFVPFRARLTVAYDNGSTNAFRKYDPADFRLDKRPISITSDGASFEVRSEEPNILWITPEDADFRVEVLGFDHNRDVIINPWSREISDAEAD